jgi:16S rRNA (cytosine1402-N4)-methyltransferase
MTYHIPVLLKECIENLIIEKSGVYIDGTLGGGGHSEEILKSISESGKLYSIDQDIDAINFAKKRLAHFGNFQICQGNFRYIKELTYLGENSVDGILLDLGVSSYQLDEGSRGFSFQADAELDMRMNKNQSLSAHEIVNNYSEKELTRIFFEYGEEKNSRKIARAIVNSRIEKSINTTSELAKIIEKNIPKKFVQKSLARIFQAIRIEVNGELDALKEVLESSFYLLKKGGRLVIMSYHSLEDRIVKQFIARKANPSAYEDILLPNDTVSPDLKKITRKPILASDEEISLNSRSRSAKLRVAEKL